MSILPLMDALILLGWSSLVAGGLLKAVYVTTHYRPTLLGLGPADLLAGAAVALLFALTLAARAWVKAAEPELLRRRRRHYEPGRDERLAAAEETTALEAAPPLREARR